MVGDKFWYIAVQVMKFHPGWKQQIEDIRDVAGRPSEILNEQHFREYLYDLDSREEADNLHEALKLHFAERQIIIYEFEADYTGILDAATDSNSTFKDGHWPVQMYLVEDIEKSDEEILAEINEHNRLIKEGDRNGLKVLNVVGRPDLVIAE